MIDSLTEMEIETAKQMRENELTLFGPRDLGSGFIFMRSNLAWADFTQPIAPEVVADMRRNRLLEELDPAPAGQTTVSLQYRLTDLARNLPPARRDQIFGFGPPGR